MRIALGLLGPHQGFDLQPLRINPFASHVFTKHRSKEQRSKPIYPQRNEYISESQQDLQFRPQEALSASEGSVELRALGSDGARAWVKTTGSFLLCFLGLVLL